MSRYIRVILPYWLLLNSLVYSQSPLDITIVDYPPYEFVEDNEVKGIAVDIIREVFNRMNQPIALRALPWPRALKELETGEIDGAIEVFYTEEREAYMDFCKEVLLDEFISLFVSKDSKIKYNGDLSSLAEYTFGVKKGFSYGSIFDSAVEAGVIKNLVVQVYDGDRLFHLLAAGRVEILIGDKYALPYQYTKGNIKKEIKRLIPDVQAAPTYVVFSKKRKLINIRDKFDVIIRDMKNDGSYDRILIHWDSLFNF